MGERLLVASINTLGCRYPILFDWLTKVSPDILLVQEVYERDLARLSKAFGARDFFYSPMAFKKGFGEENFESWGIAIITKFTISRTDEFRYSDLAEPPHFNQTDQLKPSSRILQIAEIETPSGEIIRIGNTHFTWTSNGLPNPQQEKDLARLIPTLREHAQQGLILGGDFNAPRPNTIWTAINKTVGKGNIPENAQTTLFNPLHRAGGNLRPLVVDELFSTPDYEVFDVLLHPGLSDHYAITAWAEQRRRG